MNQDQRKFLIERVNKTFSTQCDVIRAKEKLPRPSLNNYLIAAFLDGSIKFNNIDALKEKMRAAVLKFGASDQLIKENDDGFTFSSRNRRRSETKNVCEVAAEDLFIVPEAYIKALEEYKLQQEQISKEIADLEAQKDTILLKIQIGSNTVLDKLITQVDNLADLNIMNSQFLLSDSKTQK